MPHPKQKRRPKPRKPADPGHAFEGVVVALGAQGDGITDDNGESLFVPFALPGERVRGTARNGRLEDAEILEPSSARVEPPCPVFTRCGGCALQHLGTEDIAAWKREQVATALGHRGLGDANVVRTFRMGTDIRRRVTVHYESGREGKVKLGFLGRRSHRLVPVEECLVLNAKLRRVWKGLATLAGMLGGMLGGKGQIYCLDTEEGPDIDLRPAAGTPETRLQGLLIAQAKALGSARLSVHGEVIAEWRPPRVAMVMAHVTPPPGAFLQPSVQGQDVLTALVLEGAGEPPFADLFAGCGTFTFPLAGRGAVHAVENDAAALGALDAAARHIAWLKPVTWEERDLFEWPLTAKELKRFGTVVFDPPRAGAEAQARELAVSQVPRIVAVSCNPATFARDARILVDGGYALTRVAPVDQFPWSPHIECVGVFARL